GMDTGDRFGNTESLSNKPNYPVPPGAAAAAAAANSRHAPAADTEE
ncbi:unnamed protein product, partial [Adineta steineri]